LEIAADIALFAPAFVVPTPMVCADTPVAAKANPATSDAAALTVLNFILFSPCWRQRALRIATPISFPIYLLSLIAIVSLSLLQ
jgi:hypothetical protein